MNDKPYDLEERTALFAEKCRNIVNQMPKTIGNIEYSKQLIRSSGSVASNYIEANEALGKKDFQHRIRISRKEGKESRLWLRLIQAGENDNLIVAKKELIKEAFELTKILTAILDKSL